LSCSSKEFLTAKGGELLVICDWLLGKKMKKSLLQGSAGILPAQAPAAMMLSEILTANKRQ
jgi:hypothetical protein